MKKSFASRFRNWDAYAKTLDDFTVKTSAGAILTLLSGFIISCLVISQFSEYLQVTFKSELSVDKSRGQELPINIDVTFPHITCDLLSIDSVQETGEHKIDLESSLFKTKLDMNGIEIRSEKTELRDTSAKIDKELKNATPNTDPDYCGPCYGGEPEKGAKCCNTCAEVKAAYERKGWLFEDYTNIEQCVKEGIADKVKKLEGEGCRIHGSLKVKKVPGLLSLTLGDSFFFGNMMLHTLYSGKHNDYSHVINNLSFGEAILGQDNPLNGYTIKVEQGHRKVQYFLNVVATDVKYLNGTTVKTNQFSVTEHSQTFDPEADNGFPGIYFKFNISPILITYNQTKQSFAYFLTGICAIIGGIFTVTSIIDAAIYNAKRTLSKKIELGKAS